MSSTKIIRPSVDAMAIMMQRYLIPETGVYKTVKVNPLNHG